MNKAILIAAGLFTLMNAVTTLISRQELVVEETVTIPYVAPVDSVSVIEEPEPEPIADSVIDTATDSIPADESEPQIEHVADMPPETDTTAPESPSDSDTEVPSPESTDQRVAQSPEPPVAVQAPVSGPELEAPPAEPVRSVPEPAPAALSPADSLLLLIPERAWADSHRTRRELTPEIAREHPRGQFVPRTIENSAWGEGEHLVFSIDYGFYTAGTATMSILATEMVNGAESYHIRTTATSNDFISKFYKVRDQVNSYIDTRGIFSRRIEKILREGDYHSDRFVDFYPDRKIAVSTVDKHPVTEIPLYVQDVLSSLYLIRTYPLEVGKDFSITTYADGKVYPLRVTVHKMETIEVPAGKFRCYVVEPFLQSDGIFRQKGKLTVWLSADEHRLPVKMTSKIVIGSIGTNLTSYRLGATE